MTATAHAERMRADKRAQAAEVGIDDSLIGELVDRFYARIQADELLGPIFAQHIADWSQHLLRMKQFWASIMIEPGRFSGSPMQKHIALGILTETHFDRWLALWDETVALNVASPAAAERFRNSAHRIADSLLTGVLTQRGGLAALRTRAPTPAPLETKP
ncbi:group III truncated hemoglobin [Blastomonas sp. AAP53]|uniref:group III truncated hemoglobin n=1 Tax=Blastomonas sp. AAP53 TaxID=1248760 RepID=UPI00031C428D|nr:group III truncated hemoglobin [Blastomonas sp. AAP53]